MQSINFKRLTENDLRLLHNWFQKPHVKQWYARGENYSLEMIKEKYLPRINNPDTIPNFIVYADTTPIGYIQLYCLTHSLPDGVSDYTHPLFNNHEPKQMAGIDLFIAEEKYLQQGYGTLLLKNFIREYVKNKFSILVVDPLKTNTQAVMFFEKNGFKKWQVIPANGENELLLLNANNI